MFTKQIAAFVIAASVIAAPAFAATTKTSAAPAAPAKISTSAPTVKAVKHFKVGKRHVHHARAKHGKFMKVTHVRKHRAHVVRNSHAPLKTTGRI